MNTFNSKFSTNSSYKIIRICNDPNIKLTFDTYYLWEKRNFDIINIIGESNEFNNGRNIINAITNVILENNEVDAIVFQSDTMNDNKFNILNSLPEYYKRKLYYYDTKNNYGIDLALRINKDQLTHYSDPLFSIITPLYNTNLKYFKQAYQSLCDQTLNDWEWVLTDDSPEPLHDIKEFIESQRDVRLKYFRIGPTDGNIGLSKWRGNCMSTGKWLIEFDHDDMLYPWTLQTIKEAIEAFPDNKFIYSDNTTIDANNNVTKCMYGKDYEWGMGYGHSYISKTPIGGIRTDASGPITNATIRHIVGVPNHLRCWERNFYFSIGGHNQTQRIADDYELIVRSFLKTKFTHISLCCYAQRFDGNNSQYKDNKDTDGQGNINDIQRRVRLISIYYGDEIHNRLEQVGLDDSKWISGDPYETAHVYKKLHTKGEYNKIYEDIYIPEWTKE